MNRKPIFAANWKMNKGPSETEDFVKSFLSKLQGQDFPCEIVIAPPFVSLSKLADMLHSASAGQNAHAIQIAAQNCSQFDAGAYTGEVSVMMLREFFVHYVILGHSERRSIYGETDAIINAKMKKAREANLKPIFCIGETLAEREGGLLETVLRTQVTDGLKDISEKDILETVIAYEPVWAIGTGVTATSQQAQDAHAFVRSILADLYGADTAAKIRIQYGGSVKPGNAAELMACPDIDGALIGGAALEPQSFLEIIRNGCA
jgi:triosephosphate isomerase